MTETIRVHGTRVQPRDAVSYAALVFTVIWCIMLPLTSVQVPIIGNLGAMVFVAALWLTDASRTRPGPRVVLALIVALMLLAIGALAGSSMTPRSPESLSNFVVLVVSFLCVGVISYGLASRPGQIVVALRSLVLGAAILAASVWMVPNSVNGRFFGLGNHPVEVGGILGTAIAIAVFVPFGFRNIWIVRIVLIGLLSSGVLRAGALTGLVAAAVGVLFALVLARSVRRLILVIVAVFLGGCLIYLTPEGAVLFDRFWVSLSAGVPGDLRAVGYNDSNTLASRFATMQLGIERAWGAPLTGIGYTGEGTYVLGNLQPHNVLIYAWLIGGVAMVAVYLLVLYAGTARFASWLHRRYRRAVPPSVLAVGAGAGAAWASGLSGPQLHQPWWLLAILLPVALVLTRRTASLTTDSEEI